MSSENSEQEEKERLQRIFQAEAEALENAGITVETIHDDHREVEEVVIKQDGEEVTIPRMALTFISGHPENAETLTNSDTQ